MAATEKTLKLGIDAKEMQTGAAHANHSMIGMMKQMALMMAAMKALQQVIDSFSVLAKFNRQISILAAVTGKSRPQLSGLTKEIERLGAATEWTTTEVAQSAVEYARAGFSMKETTQVLSSTIDLATLAELSMADAANITATTLRQFNLSVAQTSRVTDVLTTIANSAATNVRQLGDGMKYAGTLAATMGVSLEEVAGAMGTMANAGIRGSMAGTQLRQILIQLVRPTARASRVLADLGLTAEQVDPSINKLSDIMNRLRGITGGQAASLVGTRNVAGLLTLVNRYKELIAMTSKANNAAGASAKAAAVIRDDLQGDLDMLSAAYEAKKKQVASLLEPAARGAVQDLTKALRGERSVTGSATDAVGGVPLKTLKAAYRLYKLINGEREEKPKSREEAKKAAEDELYRLKKVAEFNKKKEENQREFDKGQKAKEKKTVALEGLQEDFKLYDQTLQKRLAAVELLKIAGPLAVEAMAMAESQAIDSFERGNIRYDQINEVAVQLYKQTLPVLQEEAKELDKLDDKVSDLSGSFKEAGVALLDGLGNALVDLMFSFTNLEDAAQVAMRSIVRELFRVLVVKQAVNQATKFLGLTAVADGGAFSGGKLIPFADGGAIVDRPTMFPMAGNNVGLMGEAGAEGIFPLKRKNGKLGIEASGGGSKTVNNYNVTVYARDAGSFKRSERQIADRLRRMNPRGAA